MAAQRGLEFLLKLDTTGSANFVTLGGGQTIALNFNNEVVDITSQDDTDRHRELLQGGGVFSAQATAEGVFKDNANDATLSTIVLANTHREWQVIVPAFISYETVFQVTTWSFTATHNAEVRWSIALDSSGTVTPTTL